MSGVFPNLMAVALAAHVVLGCCWHHGHACRRAPADTNTVDLALVGHCSQASGREDGCPHGPASGGHHGPDGCNGGRCVFVTDRSRQTPAAPGTQLPDVPTAAATADEALSAESDLSATAFTAAVPWRPVRTHLLHQVQLL